MSQNSQAARLRAQHIDEQQWARFETFIRSIMDMSTPAAREFLRCAKESFYSPRQSTWREMERLREKRKTR